MRRLVDLLAGAVCITLILSMVTAASLILAHVFLKVAQAVVWLSLRGWMP